VIDIGIFLVASVVDAGLVGVPRGRIDVDGQRAHGGERGHHGVIVVVGQLDVTVDTGNRGGAALGREGAGVVDAYTGETPTGEKKTQMITLLEF
jgi:hypothetical protein